MANESDERGVRIIFDFTTMTDQELVLFLAEDGQGFTGIPHDKKDTTVCGVFIFVNAPMCEYLYESTLYRAWEELERRGGEALREPPKQLMQPGTSFLQVRSWVVECDKEQRIEGVEGENDLADKQEQRTRQRLREWCK